MRFDRIIKSFQSYLSHKPYKSNKTNRPDKPTNRMLWLPLLAALAVVSCAKMGQPDGGWYDETPPVIVRTTPQDQGTNIKDKKISIHFDEYIKVDNPTEKVVISPPQIEQAEIVASGKKNRGRAERLPEGQYHVHG